MTSRRHLDIIRDVDTGVLYLHAQDTGIHPIIIAMGEVRVWISKKYPRDKLVKMSDAAAWHERESERCSGVEQTKHIDIAKVMRDKIAEAAS